MRKEKRLIGNFLDHTRFARRHLADDGGEYRRTLMRDGGDAHRHVERLQRHIAVAFAERRFRLQAARLDQTFDYDFRARRHVEVDAHAFGDLDWPARGPARNAHFIDIDGEFLRAGEHHYRRRADYDRAGHRL